MFSCQETPSVSNHRSSEADFRRKKARDLSETDQYSGSLVQPFCCPMEQLNNDRTPPLHWPSPPQSPTQFHNASSRHHIAGYTPVPTARQTPGFCIKYFSSSPTLPTDDPPRKYSCDSHKRLNSSSQFSSSTFHLSSSSCLSSLWSPCLPRRRCHHHSFRWNFASLAPTILFTLALIFMGPFDTVGSVSGQVYGNMQRQYWLMCPTAGGNATINVTCLGVNVPGAPLVQDPSSYDSSKEQASRGPIIRIVELRAHLISDQRVWSGVGPRSCAYTRELNNSEGTVAMSSLGSLPVPVDPQDNVSDMLMKNCQAQTFCLSTDSKNINAKQFSETFKSIPEAGDVFHDPERQMKVPVVLELGYLCTINPSPENAPLEMCAATAKNATSMDVPVKDDGSTVTTWLWSPNYQREDTPSQTSCECILRTSSPSINVTLVAYHVRSWNSKTNGFRNIINQRVLTLYNNECTENWFEANRDPCVPALCRKSANGVASDGSMSYGDNTNGVELRLSSECLFEGVSTEREFYMRRVWFAIETSYKPSRHLKYRRRRYARVTDTKHKARRRRQYDYRDDYGADGAVPGADDEYGDGAYSYNQEYVPDESYSPGDGGGGQPGYEEEYTGDPTVADDDAYYDDQPDTEIETEDVPPMSPTGKPTVTVTCYNYARETQAPRDTAAASSLRQRFTRLPNQSATTVVLQSLIWLARNSPVLLFAMVAHAV